MKLRAEWRGWRAWERKSWRKKNEQRCNLFSNYF